MEDLPPFDRGVVLWPLQMRWAASLPPPFGGHPEGQIDWLVVLPQPAFAFSVFDE